jgi:hypothetical protein
MWPRIYRSATQPRLSRRRSRVRVPLGVLPLGVLLLRDGPNISGLAEERQPGRSWSSRSQRRVNVAVAGAARETALTPWIGGYSVRSGGGRTEETV